MTAAAPTGPRGTLARLLAAATRLVTGRGGGLVARTAGVTAAGFALAQAFRLASNLATTRFLSDEPEAFALMSFALVINTFVIMLSDIGIQSSIIRSQVGDEPRFLRTAWVTTIGRNLILFVLVLGVTAGIAGGQTAGLFRHDSVLSDPELPAVMVAIGVVLLVSGFNSVSIALARRHMRAVRITAFELGVQLFGSAVTIGLCWAGYGVWGLVGGTLFGALITAGLSHVVLPGPRMAFTWHREDFSELFHFGKWLLLASACGFLVNQADKLIFSYYFDADSMSLYAIASIWVAAVIALFSKVLQMAFYPALSQAHRRDPASVAPAYARLRLVLDGICVLSFTGAVLLHRPMFKILYEPPFEDASRYFAILVLSVLLLPYRLLNTVLLSQGDSRRFTLVTAAGALYTVTIVPAAFVFGSETVAVAAFAGAGLVTGAVTVWLTRRAVAFSALREGRMLVAFGLGAAFIATQG